MKGVNMENEAIKLTDIENYIRETVYFVPIDTSMRSCGPSFLFPVRRFTSWSGNNCIEFSSLDGYLGNWAFKESEYGIRWILYKKRI
jgi:hypothetical protein